MFKFIVFKIGDVRLSTPHTVSANLSAFRAIWHADDIKAAFVNGVNYRNLIGKQVAEES
jgi:hypothetical protein